MAIAPVVVASAAFPCVLPRGERPAVARPPRASAIVVTVLIAPTACRIIILIITAPSIPQVTPVVVVALHRDSVAVNDAMDPCELMDDRAGSGVVVAHVGEVLVEAQVDDDTEA
ncbi:hypothetical protein ZWY2020_021230 [Hordeum vulgare]|nr:hypothetical protein ZWY2020_021230 [Hordeum vulgare]